MGDTNQKFVNKLKMLVILVIMFSLLIAIIPLTVSSQEMGNLPPIADAGGPYVVDEGMEIEFDASNSWDPEGDTLFFRWYVEGEWTEWSFSPYAYYIWFDDWNTIVIVEVSDGDNISNASADVMVNNVDPIVFFEFDPFVLTEVGMQLELTWLFQDPGGRAYCDDTHTALFDWGDGGESTGIVNEEEQIVTGSYSYYAIGVYNVTLTVTDDDGGFGSALCHVIVMGVDAGSDVTILEGETFSSSGLFLILFGEVNEIFVDYGDDTGIQQVLFNEDDTFELEHIYYDEGIYIVDILLRDYGGEVVGLDSLIVTVESKGITIEEIIEDIDEMDLPKGLETSLQSKLENALDALNNNQTDAAINKINAFINQVEAQRGKKLSEDEADALIASAELMLASINN